MAKLAQRFDAITPRWDAKKNDNGALTGTAFITRTGVFPYRKADGTTVRELRHPDDVFKADSIATAKLKPIQVEHRAMLDANNAKVLKVGSLGDGLTIDAPYVAAPFTVDSADGIKAIEGGKRELSMGYTCDLVPANKGDSYNGQPYDYKQTNIVYNHLAITDAARLGSELRVHLDSTDGDVAYCDPSARADSLDTFLEDNMALKKINLDGIEYEAAAEVAHKLTSETKRADAADAAVVLAKSEATAAKAKADSAQEKLDKLEKEMPAKIADAVKARVKLVEVATKKLDAEALKKLDTLSDLEIKKAVILADSPKAAEALKTADAAYVDTRYGIVLETFDGSADKKGDSSIGNQRRAMNSSARMDARHGREVVVDAEASRQRMIDKMEKGMYGKGDPAEPDEDDQPAKGKK